MAIAFDAHAVGSLDASWSHTCTGANLLLTVGLFGNAGGGASLISGVTYNGVAMTRAGTILNNSDRWIELWYLLAPATGTHTIAVTSTADHYLGGSLSFTGVGALDQSGTASSLGGAGTSSDVTLTVATNALIVGAARESNGFPGAWTLLTEDATASPGSSGLHNAYGVPFSGSRTAGFSNQPFSPSAAVIASFTEAGATPPTYSVYANPAANVSITTIGPYILDDAGRKAAAARIIAAGAQHYYEILQWSALEATVGVYSDTLVTRLLTQSGSLPIWLQIAVVDSDGARHVPSSLSATAWDNSAMTTAFANFLTHLQGLMGSRLVILLVGNEIDTYFTGHSGELSAYGTFLSAARTQARSLWGSANIRVTTTFTINAVTHFTDYAALTAVIDLCAFTLYYMAGHDPTDDYDAVEAAAAGPFIFQEIGFTSDTATWSQSQAIQNAVLAGAIADLPTRAMCKGFTWFTEFDYSLAVLTDAGYTTPLLEFFAATGLRTTANRAKTGWPTLVTFLGGVTGDLPDGHQTKFAVRQSVNRAGTY